MMMNPFVRFVSRVAACAALSCAFAFGSSAQAGFITEALDVIEAATLGSPGSDDSSEISSYSLQSTGTVAGDGIVEFAELQLIGDTGHGAGFAASLFGAGLGGPASVSKSAGAGGSGSGGVSGYQFHASGGFFAGVLAPGALGNGQNSFTLEVGGSTSTLTGGSVATFGPGVTDFVVSGIDPTAGLLPGDPSPFNPILAGGGTVTVTPVVSSDVVVVHNNPEPGSLTLLGLGVAGLFVWGRRRTKKQNAA
jgi:hypothetical protein